MDTREIIQYAIDYIDENITSDFDINDLCANSGYSFVHFNRLFSLHIGVTPKEYILRRKLLYAIYDMVNGEVKINVSLKYGFDTYAGFYKAFKREFGCSPSEFIKSYAGSKPHKINILQEEQIMVSKTKVKKLLPYWNLENNEITNIINENTGRQNENAYYIGNDFVIKYSANLASVKKAILFSEIAKLANGNDYLKSGDLYYIVVNRVKGKQLKCEEIFNDTHIAYTIGKNIAKLHNKLCHFNPEYFYKANVYNECISNIGKVKKFVNISDEFINDYKNNFGKMINELPTQLIHRDINPSNMLFDHGDFKGFIDFDLIETNIRIFDICYCITSILSECFTQDIDNVKLLEILNNVIDGYNSINQLTEYEKQSISYVIYSIQIICIAYFSQYDKFAELTKTNIKMFKWLTKNL